MRASSTTLHLVLPTSVTTADVFNTSNERVLSGAMALVMHVLFFALLVFGVNTALTDAQGSAAIASLLDAHHYTDGLAFLRAGTPTNNTAERALRKSLGVRELAASIVTMPPFMSITPGPCSVPGPGCVQR